MAGHPQQNNSSGDADTTHESAMESWPPTEHKSQDHSEVDENEGEAETSEAELGRVTELSHFISELTSFQSAWKRSGTRPHAPT